MGISEYYQNSLLSEASYAVLQTARNPDGTFSQDLVESALIASDFSESQAADFVSHWRVVAHQPNKSTGLSATVFERLDDVGNGTGEFTLAVRGTDTPWDWMTDAGIFVGVTPDQTGQYQELVGLVDGWFDDGKLASGFTVVGHSLGGFLAGGLLVDYPTEIAHAFLYNAPGVGGLKAELEVLTGQQDPVIDLDSISNLVADFCPDATADWGVGWGTRIPIVIEGSDLAIWENHEISRLTDALAVHALLGELSSSVELADIGDILRAASLQNDVMLDTVVNAVGDLFEAGMPITGSEPDVRDALYTRIQDIQNSMTMAADFITIEPTSGLTLEQLIADTADGIAYRYALEHLNPFAILGDPAIYDAHNTNGELNADQFTEQYLEDSAALGTASSLERVIDGLEKLFGLNTTPLSTSNGNRDALYQAIYAIQASAGYQTALQIADFAQVVSLAGLSSDHTAELVANNDTCSAVMWRHVA